MRSILARWKFMRLQAHTLAYQGMTGLVIIKRSEEPFHRTVGKVAP